MADTKITGLAALTAPDPADVLPIVDVAPAPTTMKITVANLLAAATGASGTAWVPLTDAATIQPDAASAPKARFYVTLEGNRTLNGPINAIDGAVATFRLKQDAVGGRTITLGANFNVPTDLTVTLSTAANVTDILSAIYVGTPVTKWLVLALTKGYVGL